LAIFGLKAATSPKRSKNRRPYNLYCVGADVKPCSINQSISETVQDMTKVVIDH